MEATRYLCRAKMKDNPHWFTGTYKKFLPFTPYPVGPRKILDKDYKHLIISEGSSDWGLPRDLVTREVDPATVCQCTGFSGKHEGGAIGPLYENDIILYEGASYIVAWKEARFYLKGLTVGIKDIEFPEQPEKVEFKIIGNTFDN